MRPDVLAAVASWPVPTAAAAVVGPSGVLAATGPTERAFPLASVTKPLAALAILVAVEEEAVSLDDPADEALIPGATLRHLLAHASGLAPERPLKSFPPGVRRVYSNVGIELAASLVSAAAGMPFAQYLDEAEHLADHIAILHEGKIIASGTLMELKKLFPPAQVEYVEKQPTLEEIFLAIIGKKEEL